MCAASAMCEAVTPLPQEATRGLDRSTPAAWNSGTGGERDSQITCTCIYTHWVYLYLHVAVHVAVFVHMHWAKGISYNLCPTCRIFPGLSSTCSVDDRATFPDYMFRG